MNNAPNNPGQPEPVHRGRHERSDANVVVIALLGLSVLVQVAAVELVVTGMFDWLQRREAAGNPTLSPLSRRSAASAATASPAASRYAAVSRA